LLLASREDCVNDILSFNASV